MSEFMKQLSTGLFLDVRHEEVDDEKIGISVSEMYERLNRQGLVQNRLFACYDDLHTQSLDWVTDDTIEALHNWEAQAK